MSKKTYTKPPLTFADQLQKLKDRGLVYLLDSANDNNSLALKLDELFAKYPTVPIQYLGIPSDGKGSLLDWRKEPLFKN